MESQTALPPPQELLGILVGLTLFAEMLGEQKKGGWGSQEEPEQEWDHLACCCWVGGGEPTFCQCCLTGQL